MSTTETNTPVDRETLVNDFRSRMQGTLPDDKIEAAAASLQAATQKYPATGSVAGAIFFLKWQVTITGGKTFDGTSGGITTIGGGALFGDVYTDDLNRLYSNTKSFEYNAAFAYTSLLFFDGNANLLGHFESGSVSTIAGVGGGSGSWS